MAVMSLPTFAQRIEQFGPQSAADVSIGEAEAFCRAVASGHSENFPIGLRLLSRPLRQPMANVYAFCRWADDLGDEVQGAEESLRLLTWWRSELDDCMAGRPRHPVFVALRRTVTDFALDWQPFADLISAFVQDQTLTRYATHADLLDYCRRSADPVGRIVLRLFGEDSEAHVRRSDAVCTGLQLINFWQDVARDADIGRRYLPSDAMARHGYTDAMWRQRQTNEPLRMLGNELVRDAADRLAEGHHLARSLSGYRVRAVVGCFHRGGLQVARRIAQQGYDLWRRPRVGRRHLLAAVLASAAASLWRGRS